MNNLYTRTAYELSKQLMKRYSTSFSLSSRLFGKDIRPHIFAIYAVVRIADEIVDTYRGDDALAQLDTLEKETINALANSHHTNPLLHAFAETARRYAIDQSLIAPFFNSMRMDLEKQHFTQATYEQYIYGSAEVIGLMCLRVFVGESEPTYQSLQTGAQALGAAYQKVNFLRDIKADYEQLGRVYFPGVDYATFSETQKNDIVRDIQHNYATAAAVIPHLPRSSRRAVRASYYYYSALLEKTARASVDTLKTKRLRVGTITKLRLLLKASLDI